MKFERTAQMNTILPKQLLIFTACLILFGCSSATPIQEAMKSNSGFEGAVYEGEVTAVSENKQGLIEYRVFHHGDSGFVKLNSVREQAESRANRHCEQRDLGYRVIKEQTSVPPHILGNFPRVELIFVCEEASKSDSKNTADAYEQLERLGRLLKDGLITQAEFEREKAKLFADN